MKHSDKIDLLATALTQLQCSIQDVEKDSKNTFFKTADGKPSGYASLGAVLEVVRPHMARVGLAVVQMPDILDGKPVLTTVLMHTSGQYMSADAPLLVDKQTSQALGSALSYMRRYSLTAALGITQKDDDGHEASHAPAKPSAAPRPAVTPKAEVKAAPAPAARPEASKGKWVCPPEQRKAIYETLSIQMGLGDEGAVSYMRQISGKQKSDDWTQADVAKLHAAIESWKP